MNSTWLWVDSGPGEPAKNMAFDQALLENAASLAGPILRFYGWTQPAATFGYFQRVEEILMKTELRPLVRRPTGGGFVPHDHDWTYSLVVPPSHWWHRLTARESYRRVHEWIMKALAESGVTTELCPAKITGTNGSCFSGAEQFDLVWRGLKVAGAAQRRNSLGLLIQGSVAPAKNWPARDFWQQSMRQVLAWELGVSWLPWDVGDSFMARVESLSKTKFGSLDFTHKR